jgi:hypothetical protein
MKAGISISPFFFSVFLSVFFFSVSFLSDLSGFSFMGQSFF